MFRSIGAAALACVSVVALAQTAPAPAPAPAPAATPAAPVRDQARINAIVNAPLPDDQAAMKAHVMFLASDEMRGRDAGSPEFDIAAQYVAAQFYAAGLRPAGDQGGYLQKVPLITYKAAEHGDFVLARKGAAPQKLVFGEDYTPSAIASAETLALDAPVVFVGYGLVAPQYKRDDYKGVDVRGKIVVFLNGAPADWQSEERAHFQSAQTKAIIARAKGAVGAITIGAGGRRGAGAATGAGWDRPRVTWANPNGLGEQQGVPVLGALTQSGAAKLFAGSKTTWDAVNSRATDPKASLKPVALPGTLAVSLKTSFEKGMSSNVAGMIPGSDPKLKDEVVVLSAHLDHVGVGRPVNGDAIYNGAEDNAVGIASLIEEAKRFKAEGRPPRRSILFLAVTGEEKGLVGSDYFTKHPTVPVKSIVADVNLDMPILTYAFEDMTVYGADRSTLGPIVEKAVNAVGVTMSPDPEPEQAIFVRSDHYRFVQQGIPSVFLWPGQKGPGKAAVAAFWATKYHKPQDEIGQEPLLDWAQGVRFVKVNYAIARAIADGDERPRWNKGDFFGTLYNGFGAK
ncbi:M28 family metallopeptidase [Sphingomonas aracearum]|uniref:Aminopeptidase n=1 Tax=Sphingomonas aracearum TaxID=2283317 RepID=A0A369VXT4_9SPHN|nr:M28 family metallopeptidase [Sphingomonas aracearum]RDE05950.1 aminopeptidase [Sphingomonas aracearum]